MTIAMATQRGFTLIEVLVALTLTGLLVVALFAGFRVGIDSWDSANRHIQRVEDGRSLVNLLSRHLSQIQLVRMTSGQGDVEPAFLGTASSLRYVAPLSLSTGNRLYLIELVSDHEGQQGTWVRFSPWQSSGDIDTIFADAKFQQVSEYSRFEFAYFNEDEPRGWVEESRAVARPPRLVSVKLTDQRGEWPRLTLATGQ